jgi:hypothetical protein
MTPQNPFDTWENSDDYYGLQDQISNIRLKQQDSKTMFSAGAFGRQVTPEARAQQDMLNEEFDRQLQRLNQMSAKGKFNFNFQGQNSGGSSQSAVNGVQPQFNF